MKNRDAEKVGKSVSCVVNTGIRVKDGQINMIWHKELETIHD